MAGSAMNKPAELLKKRTFHHSKFSDIKKLVQAKEKKNCSISLCFPTFNEETTIGKSIRCMKKELMTQYPLIDEIVVVDSGSADNTLATAHDAGAEIYIASELLQEEGEHKGKGENLWKALYVLKGDIILFLDADISNIHTRFAYGLLGPLLLHNDMQFVKGFYKRPVMHSGTLKPTGGGRVTEILIRPLFSQFFPDLATIIQPLSGEYAGYRTIFEQIPFPTGYGIETAMLIDIYQNWGLEVIGQTDLDRRVHRNQHISSLGKMSFGIMQAFWKRLNKYKNLAPLYPESVVLQAVLKENSHHNVYEYRIEEFEREPISLLPAYRERFHPSMVEEFSFS